MVRELRFPRRLKRDYVSYRLVMIRRIPDRPQAAIYRSLPIFSKGMLVEDYLVMGPGGQVLAHETSFEAALKTLFLAQPSLRKQSSRARRPPSPGPIGPTAIKELTDMAQLPELTERLPKVCSGG